MASSGAPSQDPTYDPQEEGGGEEVLGDPNCLVLAVGSFVGGGVLGGLVGSVGGIFKRQGLKAVAQEGWGSSKTFALMSGVHSLVTCAMTQWRKKDDVINQGVAGCASGIALGIGGPPSTMLVNCAGFAAFAFIYEILMARSALAAVAPGGGRVAPARGRRGSRTQTRLACRSPVCHGVSSLREVLSLGVPCWLFSERGCSIPQGGR